MCIWKLLIVPFHFVSRIFHSVTGDWFILWWGTSVIPTQETVMCRCGLCLHPKRQAGHMGDFSQRILLDCQKCPIAKKSQYKLLLFWQCYHIVVLQAKQENTDAYVSSVKVCLDREALGHGDKALHCWPCWWGQLWCCLAAHRRDKMQGSKRKGREGLGLGWGLWMKHGVSRELRQSQACSSNAASPSGSQGWCYWHRQLAGLSSSWGQAVHQERCKKLPSHQTCARLSWCLSPLCVSAGLVWLEWTWQNDNKVAGK